MPRSPLRAALAAAVALAAAPALAETAFVCRGNEPGWSLTIEGPRARLERLGDAPEALTGELQDAAWMRPPTAVWRGRAGPETGDLFAVVTRESCADTMVDRRTGWRALVSIPGEPPRFGCCTAPRVVADARPAADWTRLLPDLLPMIEACRARVPAGAVVTKAWPMNRGLGGSRWRAPDGARSDCVAELTGQRVDSVSAVRDGGRLPGEGDPLFVPTGQRVVGAEPCTRAQPVARDGWIAGFVVYRVCR